jgi:hypothetical protein
LAHELADRKEVPSYGLEPYGLYRAAHHQRDGIERKEVASARNRTLLPLGGLTAHQEDAIGVNPDRGCMELLSYLHLFKKVLS